MIDLLEAIRLASHAMLNHPEHELAPLHRLSIYSALTTRSDGSGGQARARLALLTARHVLPIWTRARPDDPLMDTVLELVTGVIHQTVDVEQAHEEAGHAWEVLDELGGNTDDSLENERIFYAGMAGVEALFEVLGKDPFAGIDIDACTTNDDLDPWCSDSAVFAAIAWAGAAQDPRLSRARRREFWEWWLATAVSQPDRPLRNDESTH